MEQSIQLYGFLILAMLGVVAPFLVILMSMFPEGTARLTKQYETEKESSEKNIREQLKKLGEAESVDQAAIQDSLRRLEQIKKEANVKLAYLDPKKQILKLFLALSVSFVFAELLLLLSRQSFGIYNLLLLVGSLLALAYSLRVLWNLLCIIIEVRKFAHEEQANPLADALGGIRELLATLANQENDSFLKQIYISINGDNIENDEYILKLFANTPVELKIGVHNQEARMAKTVEIGFVVPHDFIIEKSQYYKLYTDEIRQIVRYRTDYIHGRTHHLFRPLKITALNKGSHQIRTFIKAENVEVINRNVTMEVEEQQQ